MRTTIEVLEEGSLGFFWNATSWPPRLNSDDAERGWIRLDRRKILLSVLDETPFEEVITDRLERPSAIVGVLPDDGVLLLLVGPRLGTRTFGSERASSARFEAAAVVGNIEPSELRGERLFSASAMFSGLQSWAGVSSMKESQTIERGIVKAWQAETVAVASQSAKIGSVELTIDADWRINRKGDRSTIEAPLRISCSAARARSVRELATPIIHVQDVMSLAFGGLIRANAGNCRPQLVDPGQLRSTPTFWCGPIHGETDEHLPAPNINGLPLFTLADIGGVGGLSRWVRLAEEHPRALAPVVSHFRNGLPTAVGLLRDVAMAFEYWVKAHRPAGWAVGKPFVKAMLTRVDSSAFQAWCGDKSHWEQEFWGAYNKLKHEHTFRWDERELADLAVSGRLVLTAAVLDTVARSHGPSTRLFTHHLHQALGDRLKRRFS